MIAHGADKPSDFAAIELMEVRKQSKDKAEVGATHVGEGRSDYLCSRVGQVWQCACVG